jgi:hypothetical protein
MSGARLEVTRRSFLYVILTVPKLSEYRKAAREKFIVRLLFLSFGWNGSMNTSGDK